MAHLTLAPPAPARRSTKSEILETGIKVIDVLMASEYGGKAGLFGGAGVGTMVLLTEITPGIVEIAFVRSLTPKLEADR